MILVVFEFVLNLGCLLSLVVGLLVSYLLGLFISSLRWFILYALVLGLGF